MNSKLSCDTENNEKQCPTSTGQSSEVCDDSQELCVQDSPEKCSLKERKLDHVCNICSKSFKGEQYLSNHMKSHIAKNPHICEICFKIFTRKGTLKDHLLTHSGERPHECSICSKSFNKKGHLKKHLLIHTGEKPHLCTTCNKSFTERGHLKRHLLTHSGEKPHLCYVCSKSFAQIGHLRVHLLTHSGDKPHVCSICSMSFRRKYFLNRHLLLHSSEMDLETSSFDRGEELSSTSEKSEYLIPECELAETSENSHEDNPPDKLQATEEIYCIVKEEKEDYDSDEDIKDLDVGELMNESDADS